MRGAANYAVVEDANRLMARVCDNDAGAFESLYDQYHRLVYGVALRILSDPGAAEDVTQSVFLKIWSDPEAFREGSFGAWIARVARNRAIDALRMRTGHPTAEVPESIPEDQPLEEMALARLSGERVRDAMGQLTPEQREPIELGFFEGITHEEIARRTGVPLGTVKTRIRSGLRRLRSVLDGVVAV